jgi:hypothetical protein
VVSKELATPAASPWHRSGVIGGRERGTCDASHQRPEPGRSGSWTFPAQARGGPASGPGCRSPIPQSRASASAAAGTSPNLESLRSAPQGPHQADADGDWEQAHPPGEWRSGVRHVSRAGGLRWDTPGGSGRSRGRPNGPGGRPNGPRCGRNRGRNGPWAGRGGDRRRTGGATAGRRSGRRGGGDAEARPRRMVAGAHHQQDDAEDQEHGDDRRHRKDGLGRGPAPSCHASLKSVELSVGV